jgi:hypothetical protein
LDLPRSRDEAVGRLRRDLQTNAWPRSQMTLLVSLTGGSGLLASFLLLQAGLDSMALRYPLALLGSYAVFLLLLWLWLRTQAADWPNIPDPGIELTLPTGPSGPSAPAWSSGGGGDFGGAGASASFDAPARVNPLIQPSPMPAGRSVAGSADKDVVDGWGTIGDAADADVLTVPLLVIALAVGLAFSSVYVIYSAPTLFAELLLDGALSATLYHRLRGIERRHWMSTALRTTAVPFVLTALLLMAVGWGLQSAAPGARSLGDAFHHIGARP